MVLGGGLTAPADWAAVRGRNQVVLSANAHGCRLAPCDYIVAQDDIREQLAGISVPVISPLLWVDYRIVEQPYIPDSGALAAWVAWHLGACPILLCGMDCYQGGTYFHDPDGISRGRDLELEDHLRNWRRLRDELPAGAPIRAVSGPVAQVFGAYRPDEDFSGYVPPDIDELMSKHAGQVVTITATGARVGFDEFAPGQTVELARLDAAELIRLHQAVAV